MRLQLVALAALVVCAHARTTLRQQQQSVTAHITSLTDKDAHQKAMVHPAFANAGRQAGVEVWRIENFDPVPVAQNDYGKFYKGDSYIVLKTTSDKQNRLSHDIHYWIGDDSSQDESGAAAILTVGLDDKYGGAAVQHRERQGQESEVFKGYFRNGIRYLDGGNASGFKHVTTNAGAEKRLLQVKGKRNVRTREVNPLISSMNKGDVFILDVGSSVYVYVGSGARNVEKLKAISVANQIRDQDHSGRATVDIVDQYSSEVDVQKFFTALGSGSPNTVPDDTAGGDDQAFEKSEEQSVVLSEVSDSSGKVKITTLAKPLRQAQLKPQEAYILDTISGSIYVWIGKQSTEKERSEAMTKAQQFRSSKSYPAWVKVTRIPQGTEPAIFKQYFQTWQDVGMKHTRVVRSLADDAQTVLDQAELDLNGNLKMKEVIDLNQKDLESDNVHIVESGEVIFLWIGREVSDTERKLVTNLASNLRMYTGHDVIVIKQGFEPDNFVSLFDKWDAYWSEKEQPKTYDEEFDNEIDK